MVPFAGWEVPVVHPSSIEEDQTVRKEVDKLSLEGGPFIREWRAPGKLEFWGISPCLQKGIGLAYLPVVSEKIGTKPAIEIRGEISAKVVKKPFYKK